MSAIRDTVVRLISIELGASEEKVRSAQSLRCDLGLDSIAVANIMFALEEQYGVELELQSVERVDTLVELETVVGRSLAAAQS